MQSAQCHVATGIIIGADLQMQQLVEVVSHHLHVQLASSPELKHPTTYIVRNSLATV